MTIVYPYNEILPKKAAHDCFIFNECAALAQSGKSVTLLCGKGSLNDAQLLDHYGVKKDTFLIHRLPIIRKNNPFNLSWNLPFFFATQAYLSRIKPAWVILSVRKQGTYHLQRKIPGVRYLYEVHEVASYPPHATSSPIDKQMLEKADLITVTTSALKEILLSPPYSLKNPIEVVPLAVKCDDLPPPKLSQFLHLAYVGQLYEGQGLSTLLAACAQTEGVFLTVIGGKEIEIALLKKEAQRLGLSERVQFRGFIAPNELPKFVQKAHAFVAPFDNKGRMPFVAHTKLFEYAHWGRPILAPKLPVVEEHFQKGGVLFYEPGNDLSLTQAINQLKINSLRNQLQSEIQSYKDQFTWDKRSQNYLKFI